MKHLRRSVLMAVIAIALVACGGYSNESTPTPTAAGTNALPTPTAVTPASSPTPAAAAFTDLSLVYTDRSKGQGVDIYVSAHDGSAGKKVITMANPAQPLDVRGKTLAVATQGQIAFLDLTTGLARNLAIGAGSVTQGRFVDNGTFMFLLANGGCGPGGGPTSALIRVDVAAMTQKELLTLKNNVTIAGVDATSSSIALVPRGCDPGLQTINIYSAADGKELQKVEAPGCGIATIDLVRKIALSSWISCTVEQGKPQATLYDYSTATVTKKDLIGPGGGLNVGNAILRPNSTDAVFGAKTTSGTGPGSVKGNGIWLINVTSLAVTSIQPAEGAEQSPIAWTSDGKYLLTQSVQAQGMCTYSFIDATTKAAKAMPASLTFCGVNGEVLGWTSLK